MSAAAVIQRYAAFTHVATEGNPAGVVLEADNLSVPEMQAIAAEVGYSETAFVMRPLSAGSTHRVRYFTPEVEVPFCGHATIATAVALAERAATSASGAPAAEASPMTFATAVGGIRVKVERGAGGAMAATMTSVAPVVQSVDQAVVDEVLSAIGWRADELDPRLPPRIAYAGARHLILAATTRERLQELAYDQPALARVCTRVDLLTVALIWQAGPGRFHARNLAPAIGIAEDPATGAAAAALGGYLVGLDAIEPPAAFTVWQGEDMGRASRIEVNVGARGAGVRVAGRAVPISSAA